jgi:hypothetical protein
VLPDSIGPLVRLIPGEGVTPDHEGGGGFDFVLNGLLDKPSDLRLSTSLFEMGIRTEEGADIL